MNRLISNENELLRQHAPLVSALVRQFAGVMPPVCSAEHLHGLGLIALLDAARTYSPAAKISFEAFARIQIHGAFVGEIRRAQRWFQTETPAIGRQPVFA
jgi:RNA polymerase sigma factor for flagellar operon FliA